MRNYYKSLKNVIAFILIISILFGTISFPDSLSNVEAAGDGTFAGFNNENISLNNLYWISQGGAAINGTSVTMPTAAENVPGTAIYFIDLNSIANSVDYGNLKISFSVAAQVNAETGDATDVAEAKVTFATDADFSHDISTVSMVRSTDNLGSAEILTSNAAIPSSTRYIYITLSGTSTDNANNTVAFMQPSLLIKDQEAPVLTANYDTGWTNQDVTISLTASDSESGIEGIYDVDSNKVSDTTSYQYTAVNNESKTFYTVDYAERLSDEITVSITNVDKNAPISAPDITVSNESWSNTPALFTLSDVTAAAGESPETRQYQLNSGAWTDYSGQVSVTQQGETVVHSRMADQAGNISSEKTKTVYIDTEKPTVSVSSAEQTDKTKATITFSAQDITSGIAEKRWAIDNRDASYFTAGNGNVLTGDTFTADAGHTYTVFAKDNAGNIVTDTIKVDAYPTISSITSQTLEEDTVRNITFTVADLEGGALTVSAKSSDTALLPDPVCVNDNGQVTLSLSPTTNKYGGPVTVTVTVTDTDNKITTTAFDVTVTSVNDKPTANMDDSITTTEDNIVTINVLQNDTDPEGDALTVKTVTDPSHGTVSLSTDKKKIIYTPTANYNGADSFTYTAYDGTDESDPATVSINVTEVNDKPIAVKDSVTMIEDNATIIDVLANDSDADLTTTSDEILSISMPLMPAHGTAEVINDKGVNKIKYTPEANWSGSLTFTYQITDRKGESATVGVTVTVTAFNDPPVFSNLDNAYTIEEDSGEYSVSFQISDMETDTASLMLQAMSKDEAKIKQSTIVFGGLGDADPAVMFKFTSVANANGDVPVTLKLSDGFKVTEKTITIHITPVNDIPVAISDSYTYTEDENLTINMDDLVTNDTDIDADTLYFDGITTAPTVGALVNDSGNIYHYEPAKDSDTTATFSYKVSDGNGGSSIGTVTLFAKAVNDAPVANFAPGNVTTVDEDNSISGIAFTVSDLETSANDLVITASSSDPEIVSSENITITKGTDGNGTLSILPNKDKNGLVSITLTVSDGLLYASKSMDLTINPIQDPPTAEDDYVYSSENGNVVIEPLKNDYDVDGDTLSIKSYSSPGNGTVTQDGNTLSYKGFPDMSSDSFTYTISDGNGNEATATIYITMQGTSFPPVVSGIVNQFMNEDGAALTLPFTVTDPDAGDTVTVTSSSDNTTLIPENTSNLSLVKEAEGKYKITVNPAMDIFGKATITITAKDSAGKITTSSFTLTVYPVNDAPVATDYNITVKEDNTKTIDLLSGVMDVDTNKSSLNIIKVTDPSHGFISKTASGYLYKPYLNYNGPDSFQYTVSDGESAVTATANLTVEPVNDAPYYYYSIYKVIPNVTGDESAAINVLSSAYDIDGDTLYTDSIVEQPKYGTVIKNANGTITYTRNERSPESNGADSFVFKIRDREDAEAGDVLYTTARVYIADHFDSSIWADNANANVNEDCDAFWINLTINGYSGDLSLTNSEPKLGTVTAVDTANKRIQYKPDVDKNGTDTFTFTATDSGNGKSVTRNIAITINAVNDSPIFTAIPSDTVTNEDEETGELNVAFTDVDNASSDLTFTASAINTDSSHPVILNDGIQVTRTDNETKIKLKPVANAYGTAQIVLQVSDGLLNSIETFNLSVTSVNDAPDASDYSFTVPEDTTSDFTVVTPNSDVDGDALILSIGDTTNNGQLKVNPDNTLTYTPNANYYGPDSFTYTLNDEKGGTDTATASIIVENVNDIPVIAGLNAKNTTAEDTTANIPFSISDVDGDTLSTSISYVSSTLFPDNSIKVTNTGNDCTITAIPAANKYGSVTVTLTVNDGNGGVVTRTIDIIVYSVNDLPAAVDDVMNTDEDTPVSLAVMSNDTDVEDGSSISILEVSATQKGGTVSNAGGILTYTPPKNYYGEDSFTYTVTDLNDGRDAAKVTVNIASVNDKPTTANDSITTNEDTPVFAFPVLNNDSDVEDDNSKLTISDVQVTSDNGGSVTISPDERTLNYIPKLNYNGTDSFTYIVKDSEGKTATGMVTVMVNPVNDAPIVTNGVPDPGTWVMVEDSVGNFGFTVTDPETNVTNLIITLTSDDQNLIADTSISLSGSSEAKNARITTVPNKNGNCKITATVSDGVNTTVKIFDVKVTAVNDQPQIQVNNLVTDEDTAISGIASGSDVDSSNLTFSLKSQASQGTVSVTADGNYSYTPNENYNGSDSFIVLVDDNEGQENSTNTATVTVTVNPVNDAPVATDDVQSTTEDNSILVDVLANDSDIDISNGDSISIVSTNGVKHGTAILESNAIRYTPIANWNGTETFSYTIMDTDGLQDTATVTITINPSDDLPANGNDIYSVIEDTPKVLQVLDNDDIDTNTTLNTYPGALDELIITALGVGINAPSHGNITLSSDSKSITYSPDANYFGADSFTYTMEDNAHHSATFTVSINVQSVNDIPEITTISNTIIDEDHSTASIPFTVSDIEDVASTLKITTASSKTAIVPNDASHILVTAPDSSGNCSVVVTPAANCNGIVTITLTVKDSHNATKSSTFTVTVNAVNDVPSPQEDTYTTNENTPITMDLLANDDVDLLHEGDLLHIVDGSITHVSGDSLGSYQIVTASGKNDKIQFAPNADWTSIVAKSETLSYLVKDKVDETKTGTVVVTVNPVNDKPVLSSITDRNFDEDLAGGTGIISFTVTDEEDDNDMVSVTATSDNTALIPLDHIQIVNPDGVDGAERTIQVTSALDQNGEATITLNATDSVGATSTTSFVVTVNPVNDPPSNGNDVFTITEDTVTVLNVLTNDDIDESTNPALEALTIVSVTSPVNGTAIIENNKITYTPKQDSNEDDSFTYTMKNKESTDEYTFTANINITPVNDAPVIHFTAGDQVISEGSSIGPIDFTVTDVDDDPATLTVYTASSKPLIIPTGNITVANKGGVNRTLTVAANAKWNGTSVITLTVKDDENCYSTITSVAKFNATVSSVNDSPTAVADNFTRMEDTPSALDVLANDTDPDLTTNPDTESLTIISVADVNKATVTITDAGKKLSFAPNTNWNGIEEFTYTIKDAAGLTSTATVKVKVSCKNDAPVAQDVTATVDEDNTASIDVLSYASDVDQDISLNTDTNANPAVEILSVIASGFEGLDHGTASVDSNGHILFVPEADWNGVEEFTYKIKDPAGATAQATVTVTVDPVNDTPAVVPDAVTTNEDTDVTVNVLQNDSDVDLSVALNSTVTEVLTVTTDTTHGPSHGSVVLNGDNTITYTPNENYNGTDTFVYRVTDKNNATATANVTVSIKARNDAPICAADTASGNEDQANITIDVLGNDTDIDQDVAVNLDSSYHTSSEILTIVPGSITGVGHGTVTIASGKLQYTPNANWNGIENFTYSIKDTAGETASGYVTVVVHAQNDAPVGNVDTASMNEDEAAIAIDVLANDTDIDKSISLNQDITYQPSTEILTIVPGSIEDVDHGTAAIVDGKITYVPAANWNGTESFTYQVRDTAGLTCTVNVMVTVSPQNDAPTALNDSVSTNEDNAVLIDVLINDNDMLDTDTALNETPSALSLHIEAGGFAGVENGSVQVVGNAVKFTPDSDWNGTETFTYTVADADGFHDEAEVTVTVSPVNDGPVATDDTAGLTEDESVTINVLANDTDPDLSAEKNHPVTDALHVAIKTVPVNGTATVNADNTITYVPASNWNGIDTITYEVIDAGGLKDTATVTLTVGATNNSPIAFQDTVTTNEDVGIQIFVLQNDMDVDILHEGDNLTIKTVTGIDNGTVTIAGNEKSITFTPDTNWNGIEEFYYTITDTTGSQSTALVSITVTPVNDAPTAVNDVITTDEDVNVVINALANDTDEDVLREGDDLSIVSTEQVDHGTAVIADDKKSITFIPDTNWNGTESFTYTMKDMGDIQSSASITVTVNAINDAPAKPVILTPTHDDYYKDGHTVHVTWSPSGDVDGDAVTYRLYFNNGSTWNLLDDNITATQYDHVLTDTGLHTNEAEYRVEAWDTISKSEDVSDNFIIDNAAPENVKVWIGNTSKILHNGEWSNQNVSIRLSEGSDLLHYLFQYRTSDKGAWKDIANGQEAVISESGSMVLQYRAIDLLGNTFSGSMQINIDKLAPAIPQITKSTEEATEGSVMLQLALSDDPGNSGNATVTMPDGIMVAAQKVLTWQADQNGTYPFAITDKAGNTVQFTVTVDNIYHPADISGITDTTDTNIKLPATSHIKTTGDTIKENQKSKSDLLTAGNNQADNQETSNGNITDNASGNSNQTMDDWQDKNAENGKDPGEATDNSGNTDKESGTVTESTQYSNESNSFIMQRFNDVVQVAKDLITVIKAERNRNYTFAGIGFLLLLLLLFRRPVYIEYLGIKDSNKKKFKHTKRRFAHVPGKGKTLKLDITYHPKNVEINQITITFRHVFTRRMRERNVVIIADEQEVNNLYIEKTQKGKWKETM